MPDFKICNDCLINKDTIFFNKDSRSKDKLSYYCKDCRSKNRKSEREKTSQYNKKYKIANKVENSIRKRKWYLNNIEGQRNYAKEYANKNRKNRAYYQLKRKICIKRATVGNFDKIIKDIYLNRPEGYHVDHMIPLQGKNVCGLHVPWNLQYLTEEDNLRKGNKHA